MAGNYNSGYGNNHNPGSYGYGYPISGNSSYSSAGGNAAPISSYDPRNTSGSTPLVSHYGLTAVQSYANTAVSQDDTALALPDPYFSPENPYRFSHVAVGRELGDPTASIPRMTSAELRAAFHNNPQPVASGRSATIGSVTRFLESAEWHAGLQYVRSVCTAMAFGPAED